MRDRSAHTSAPVRHSDGDVASQKRAPGAVVHVGPTPRPPKSIEDGRMPGPTFAPGLVMPEKKTVERAKEDLRRGKSPSTAAGEFVREEIEHVRQGKHGARSPKQAIAIGLSKARRAGVPLPPPARGRTSARTRRSAEREYEIGQGRRKPRRSSPKRQRASLARLKREPRSTVSKRALSRQAKSAGKRRARRRARAGRSKGGAARGSR